MVNVKAGYGFGMRRCAQCKKEEGKAHSRRCSYYWAFVGCSSSSVTITVDSETCFIEDTEGCPLSSLTDEDGCEGCVDCL